jgi:hypothetical protein
MQLLALLVACVLHLLHHGASTGGPQGILASPAAQAASAPVVPGTTSALDPDG